MGCSAVHSNFNVDLYTQQRIKGRTCKEIMEIALNFDFNKYKQQGQLTFEQRVQQKITNEIGNTMLPAAVEVVVSQFRKFIAFTAFDLLSRRTLFCEQNHNYGFTTNNQDCNWNAINNEITYDSLYHPPPVMDIVWKSLILDSKLYREFCYELLGGYIDRVDPLSDTFNCSKIAHFYLNIRVIENIFHKYFPLYSNLIN